MDEYRVIFHAWGVYRILEKNIKLQKLKNENEQTNACKRAYAHIHTKLTKLCLLIYANKVYSETSPP